MRPPNFFSVFGRRQRSWALSALGERFHRGRGGGDGFFDVSAFVSQAYEHGFELAGGEEDAVVEHGVEEFRVGGGVAGCGLMKFLTLSPVFWTKNGVSIEPTRLTRGARRFSGGGVEAGGERGAALFERFVDAGFAENFQRGQAAG